MNKNEEENKEEEQKWLDWAIELQSLAQAGLAY
jgi:hydrolase, NUDIX family